MIHLSQINTIIEAATCMRVHVCVMVLNAYICWYVCQHYEIDNISFNALSLVFIKVIMKN